MGASATQSRVAAKAGTAVHGAQGLAAVRGFAPEAERAGVREGGAEVGFSFGKLPIQAKLTVGEPGDRLEEEADKVTDRVMRMPAPAAGGVLQRKCATCDEKESFVAVAQTLHGPEAAVQRECNGSAKNDTEKLHRKEAGAAVAMGSRPGALPHDGQPLDGATRTYFEPRFGRDFGDVRIHTGSDAADSARSVNAIAYTLGRDIVFDRGAFAPHSTAGRRLLAHELTHVVQQSNSGVPPSPAESLPVSHPDDPAEHEADRVADAIMHGGANASVQRITAHIAPTLMRVVRFGPDATPSTFTTHRYPPVVENAQGVAITQPDLVHTFEWAGGVHVLGDPGDPCTDWEVGPTQTCALLLG